MTQCTCYRCTLELVEREPLAEAEKLFGLVDPRTARMFLCALCGNKRCPHAADHRLTCTRSNAPGQPGSLYELAPAPAHGGPTQPPTTGEGDKSRDESDV